MSQKVDPILHWLLKGDSSIRWQVRQHLLGEPASEVEKERARVARSGWGRRILALQDRMGRWGGGLYTPKWTSTIYSLLLLRAMGLERGNPKARAGTLLLLDAGLFRDGGINLWLPWRKCSETCVTGMMLGIAGRFTPEDGRIERLASHLLEQQMRDGGWNCQKPSGATHSSVHTTISVLEGLLEYEQAGGAEAVDVRKARLRGHEFLCVHRLFRSHRTGAVIDSRMTQFHFPYHWRYDILRALDYLRAAKAERDPRLQEAVKIVERRRSPEGAWCLPGLQKGKYHFIMEEPGTPSRWNTIRALRVLRWWHSA